MFVVVFLHLLFLWSQDFAECVRIVELQVSTHAAIGREAFLGCQFDMEGDMLYSLKWYKNGREFYRYVPRNIPPIIRFPTSGVNVDLSRSSSNIVTLVDLKRESAGLYRCQVSGEAPNFTTVYREKYISVYMLPKEGPKISGMQDRYKIGDELDLNCTSEPSQPEAELKWVLNEKPAPIEYVHGPWYKIQTDGHHLNKLIGPVNDPESPSRHIDAPFQTKLKLMFRVMPDHFDNGVMTIKCQATIAPLYQEETIVSSNLELPTTTVTYAENIQYSDNASVPSTSLFLIIIAFFLLNYNNS